MRAAFFSPDQGDARTHYQDVMILVERFDIAVLCPCGALTVKARSSTGAAYVEDSEDFTRVVLYFFWRRH